MSFLIDEAALRAAAQKQRRDEQRFDNDQARLKDSQNLPASFRAQVHRSDLAANKRQDRLQLLAGLLTVGLIITALYLSALWNARRSATARRALRDGTPLPEQMEPARPRAHPFSAVPPR